MNQRLNFIGTAQHDKLERVMFSPRTCTLRTNQSTGKNIVQRSRVRRDRTCYFSPITDSSRSYFPISRKRNRYTNLDPSLHEPLDAAPIIVLMLLMYSNYRWKPPIRSTTIILVNSGNNWFFIMFYSNFSKTTERITMKFA